MSARGCIVGACQLATCKLTNLKYTTLMNTKNKNNDAMGAGTGAAKIKIVRGCGRVQIEQTPQAVAGPIVCASRCWSPSRKAWQPVAIRRGARGESPILSPLELAMAAEFVRARQLELDFKTSARSMVDGAAAGRECAALMRRGHDLGRWLASVGGSLGANDAVGYEARAVNVERLAFETAWAEFERRESYAAADWCAAARAVEVGGVGTPGRRARVESAARAADSVTPRSIFPALPELESLASRLTVDPASKAGREALGLRARGLVSLRSIRKAGGVDAAGGGQVAKLGAFRINRHHRQRAARLSAVLSVLGRSDSPLLAAFAARAESVGRKWARGNAKKSAASRNEIGGAACADDLGAYFVRLGEDVASIARGVSLEFAGRLREACNGPKCKGRGVLNRRQRRRLVNRCIVRSKVAFKCPSNPDLGGIKIVRRWRDLGGASMFVSYVAGNNQVRKFSGLSACVRGLCDAWEYGAAKSRDGREVGGSWALQGSIHGLRDFSLVDPVIDSSGDSSGDDLGAGEWSAMLDGAAERLEITPSASLVAAGYSEKLASVLLDVLPAVSVEVGGVLSMRPDSGAGSGLRPSVAACLDSWAESVRDSFTKRVAAATKGAAATQARISAAKSLDLVGGLLSFASGGAGLDHSVFSEFFEGGDVCGAFSEAGRQRLHRLKERAGSVASEGPARALVPVQSQALQFELVQAGAAGAVRRAISKPSHGGGELLRPLAYADERKIRRMVKIAGIAHALKS